MDAFIFITLKNDIGETKDLSKAMPDRTRSMREQLHAWYKSVDAKFLREKNDKLPWQPFPKD